MKIKLLLLLPLFLLLSGCYNYTELNEMSIVSGIAIDKDNDLYKVSFLITNAQKPQSSSQDNSADLMVLSGTGKSITEAINDLDLKNPKKYYLGHLSSLIISQEVAKDTEKIVDFFLRNPQSLKKFYMVISKDKALDVLKIISPQEILPSENIISNLKELNEEQAIIKDKIFSEFVIDILKDGKDPSIPVVEVIGKIKDADDSEDLEKTEVKTNIEITSIALFDNYEMVTVADKNESRGINIVNNSVNDLYLSIKCKNGRTIGVLNKIKTKVDYKIRGGEPAFTVKSEGELELRETSCGYNLYDDKDIESLEKEFQKEFKKIIKSGINLAKKEKTDVLGFGNMIYKKDYDYWNKNKDDWKNIFSDIEVKVDTKVKLVSLGGAQDTMKGLSKDE